MNNQNYCLMMIRNFKLMDKNRKKTFKRININHIDL